MILVLSDVHLGYKNCNHDDFLAFLDNYDTEIYHLVLLGDFFDFWRCNNAEVVEKNEDVMEKLNALKAKKIHYIAGNHDYYILDLNKRYETNDKVTISKYLRLEDKGESFFFIHGYELEAILWEFPASIKMYEEFSKDMCYNKDTSGAILSKMWSSYQSFKGLGKRGFKKEMQKKPQERNNINEVDKFAQSIGKYPLLSMKPNENLIFGHTHRPFINHDKKVVNTGSWVDELEKKNQNSYVEIYDGKMELKFFKK